MMKQKKDILILWNGLAQGFGDVICKQATTASPTHTVDDNMASMKTYSFMCIMFVHLTVSTFCFSHNDRRAIFWANSLPTRIPMPSSGIESRKQTQLASEQASAYVPPEKDPEYRGMVKKSLLLDSINESDTYPLPKEGDIVMYEGKWKGENVLGSIRTLRSSFYGNETGWIADIIPLKEGKSENVYNINRDSGSMSVSTKELKPVKFFYVRSENGFRLTFKPNATSPSLRAPAYRPIDESTKSFKKKINAAKVERTMEDYESLKLR